MPKKVRQTWAKMAGKQAKPLQQALEWDFSAIPSKLERVLG